MGIKRRIQTERLLLRPWKLRDRYDLFVYAQRDEVGPRAGWKPHKNVDDSAYVIQSILSAKGSYAIVLKETGHVIGGLGLHDTSLSHTDPDGNALELGYVLNPDFWGNGYMPEAVGALLDSAFRSLPIYAVWCAHFHDNDQSRRVCEKSGFVYQYQKMTRIPALDLDALEYIYRLTRERFETLTRSKDTVDSGLFFGKNPSDVRKNP